MANDLETLERLPREFWPQYLADLEPKRKERVLSELRGRRIARQYVDNPVGFINDVLDESIWSAQREICEAVRDHQRVAVPACHSPGKAVTLTTEIPTPYGWTTMGEVSLGDLVYDEQGKPVEVIGVTEAHKQPCYRITFDDGTIVETAGPHEWDVLTAEVRHRRRQVSGNWDNQLRRYVNKMPVSDWRNHWMLSERVTTKNMVDVGLQTRHLGSRFAVPTTRPIEGRSFMFPEGIGPYGFGVWLGDGHTSAAAITQSFQDAPEVIGNMEMEGTVLRLRPSHCTSTTGEWGILGGKLALQALGVLGNKHIPIDILRATTETRLAVLQGLVDTDGYLAEAGSYTLDLCDKQLADNVAELVASFGWKAFRSTKPAKLYGQIVGTVYRLSFWPDLPVARLARKCPQRITTKMHSRTTIRTVIDIKPIGTVLVKCIEVDGPSHQFLIGRSFIPTHNSHLAARIIAWWIQSHALGTAQAITTATTFRQVRNILWPHIRRLHERHGLPGRVNLTEWWIGEELVSYGFSAADTDPESVQGIHSPHLMILVDEAAGIGHSLGQAFESLLSSGEVRIILLGNPPTDREGTWFEQCCKSERWHAVHLPATKTPNWTGELTETCKACPPSVPEHPIADHLISMQWAQDVADEWGEDSPMYIAKVRAEFPTGVATKVIPPGWVQLGMDNLDPWVGTAVKLGCDIASDGGDEVVVARTMGFTGEIVYANAGIANANAVDVAGVILREILDAEELNQALGNQDPVLVKVDATGVGWGVASQLERWGQEGKHSSRIIPLKVGEKASDPEKFLNQRAEMWWTGRLELAPLKDEKGHDLTPKWRLKIRDSSDRKSFAQLSYPNYRTETTGRIRIERKSEMKSRGVSSPDRAEAFLLAVYDGPKVKRRKARLIL